MKVSDRKTWGFKYTRANPHSQTNNHVYSTIIIVTDKFGRGIGAVAGSYCPTNVQLASFEIGIILLSLASLAACYDVAIPFKKRV